MTRLAVSLERAALFLDLDGTLASIEAKPADVGPTHERSALLARAHEALCGRVAVLSGRTLAEIDRITDARILCAAGVHGLQRRNALGAVEAPAAHPALGDVGETFAAMSRAQNGLIVEPKELSVALHFRGAPSAKEAIRELAERLAQREGLTLQEGDMVFELKTPGSDKGDALAAFMTEDPFQGSNPIFIGDDLTDEPGFAVATKMGGAGVLVGRARATLAGHRLDGPDDVLAWIADSLDQGSFILAARE